MFIIICVLYWMLEGIVESDILKLPDILCTQPLGIGRPKSWNETSGMKQWISLLNTTGKVDEGKDWTHNYRTRRMYINHGAMPWSLWSYQLSGSGLLERCPTLMGELDIRAEYVFKGKVRRINPLFKGHLHVYGNNLCSYTEGRGFK